MIETSQPTIGVLIRFSNSAATLPGVLQALRRQTVQPDVILGVDNRSADDSPRLMKDAGAIITQWTAPYDHSKVLNHGFRQLKTDLVLVLSSHTVLEAPDTVERMRAVMLDPKVACVSGKWDADSYYSDSIDWSELKTKGLKFGSIYSNSMGMIRRSLWEDVPFDERMPTSEDYQWAITQVRRGFTCERLDFPFLYQRAGCARHAIFAKFTFLMARAAGLRVAWLGPAASLKYLIQGQGSESSQTEERAAVRGRLHAWLTTRFCFTCPTKTNHPPTPLPVAVGS